MKKFGHYFWSTFLALYFSFAGYMIYELAVHIIPTEHGWVAAIGVIALLIHLSLYTLLVWVLGNVLEQLDNNNDDKRKPA